MTRWVKNLLIANVAVYFLQQTMPGVTDAFMFVPAYAFGRPWTFVTYMFLHGSIWHILFNMIGLYFFGPRVEQRMGANRFLWLYFLSGISGGLLSLILAPNAPIIGASAAIFGVVLAFARFWPTDKIYIWGVLPLEARWLVVLTIVWAIYSGLTGSTGGVADYAHLGGYVGAYVYLKWLEATKGSRRFRELAASVPADRHLSNLEARRRAVDPRAEPRRGQPHPGQDQRLWTRQPYTPGEAVPVEFRTTRRPGHTHFVNSFTSGVGRWRALRSSAQ